MVNNRDVNKPRPFTLSVPAAGKLYFGLSRNGSYDAARRGDLPVMRVGRLLKVSVPALEKRIEQAGAIGHDLVPGAAPEPQLRHQRDRGDFLVAEPKIYKGS